MSSLGKFERSNMCALRHVNLMQNNAIVFNYHHDIFDPLMWCSAVKLEVLAKYLPVTIKFDQKRVVTNGFKFRFKIGD